MSQFSTIAFILTQIAHAHTTGKDRVRVRRQDNCHEGGAQATRGRSPRLLVHEHQPFDPVSSRTHNTLVRTRVNTLIHTYTHSRSLDSFCMSISHLVPVILAFPRSLFHTYNNTHTYISTQLFHFISLVLAPPHSSFHTNTHTYLYLCPCTPVFTQIPIMCVMGYVAICV